MYTSTYSASYCKDKDDLLPGGSSFRYSTLPPRYHLDTNCRSDTAYRSGDLTSESTFRKPNANGHSFAYKKRALDDLFSSAVTENDTATHNLSYSYKYGESGVTSSTKSPHVYTLHTSAGEAQNTSLAHSPIFTGTNVHTQKPACDLYNLRTWNSELNLNRAKDSKSTDQAPASSSRKADKDSSAGPSYTSTFNTLINSDSSKTIFSQPRSSSEDKMKIFTGLPLAGSTGSLDLTMLFTQIARINDHLYLCSINALSPQKIHSLGITLVVSAMIDPPPANVRGNSFSNLHVCVEDIETANLKIHFDRVADRIANEQQKGGKIVVHCMAGVSRSSSLVMAYLMKHQNMSLAQAFQHVRTIRPCIHPNAGFWRQLVEYEKKIRGTNSVELVPASSPYNLNSSSVGLFGGGRYRTPFFTPRTSVSNWPGGRVSNWPESDRVGRTLSRPQSYIASTDPSLTAQPRSSSKVTLPPSRDYGPYNYSLYARY